MMTEITVQIVLSALQTTGLLVGIFYYIMTLRNTRKSQQQALDTRKTQLFMQIYDKFNKDDVTIQKGLELNRLEFSDYDDFIDKYGLSSNPEIFSRLYYQMMFYEGLGILVARKLVDIEMVEDFMSGVIMSFWGKFGPVFLELRTRASYPTWAEWTEYLYNQIEPIYRKQHGEEAIQRYFKGERKL